MSYQWDELQKSFSDFFHEENILLRNDEVVEGNQSDKILANAPEKEFGCDTSFIVEIREYDDFKRNFGQKYCDSEKNLKIN